MANGVVLASRDGKEPTLYLVTMRCCSDYPIALGYPIGRCKKCGERPHPTSP